MIVYLPVLVFIIGVLIYFVATNPKVLYLGQVFIWAGCLSFLLTGGEPVVRVVT